VDKANAKLDALAAHFAAHPTKKNKRVEKASGSAGGARREPAGEVPDRLT
jgi:hypothetical protein